MIAAAPSLTPDALPAVTVPGERNGVFSRVRSASVVAGRGCSSLSTVTGLPLESLASTATISAAKNPFSIDCPARCWLRQANAS